MRLTKLKISDLDLVPTGNPEEFLVECPECGRRKCYANPRKGFAYCQRCGKGYHLDTRSTSYVPRTHVPINPNIRYDSLSNHALAIQYLNRRGYAQSFATKLGIQARLVGRETAIGFPSNRNHSYERRITSEKERGTDWLTPGNKYPWIASCSPTHPGLVLVEGVFDAMRVAMAGFVAAACHGKTVPWERIPWSSIEGSDKLLVLFDSDAVSEAKLTAVRGAILGKRTLQLSESLGEKDPDLCSPSNLEEILTAGLRILSSK